jgi:hypothetical protein
LDIRFAGIYAEQGVFDDSSQLLLCQCHYCLM